MPKGVSRRLLHHAESSLPAALGDAVENVAVTGRLARPFDVPCPQDQSPVQSYVSRVALIWTSTLNICCGLGSSISLARVSRGRLAVTPSNLVAADFSRATRVPLGAAQHENSIFFSLKRFLSQ